MPSFDNRTTRQALDAANQPRTKQPLIPPSQQPPVRARQVQPQQTPPFFPEQRTQSANQQPAGTHLPVYIAPPANQQPYLPETTRHTLFSVSTETQKRVPLVIKAAPVKPPLPPTPADQRRQHRLVKIWSLVTLVVLLGLTFFWVSPLGQDLTWNFSTLRFSSKLLKGPSSGPDSLVAQATATAVFHHNNDGYDPYYNGGQIFTNSGLSLDWPIGECTYWANYEYHQYSGYWVAWSGNAYQWVAGAEKAGWNVSRSPHIPAIIVLMPFVQMASSYGHVAVVVKSLNSTTVQTSNMNWYANGGGFDRVSYVNFTTGPGVYFIWHA